MTTSINQFFASDPTTLDHETSNTPQPISVIPQAENKGQASHTNAFASVLTTPPEIGEPVYAIAYISDLEAPKKPNGFHPTMMTLRMREPIGLWDGDKTIFTQATLGLRDAFVSGDLKFDDAWVVLD